jgi:4'-phosphopantetheinyl transferase
MATTRPTECAYRDETELIPLSLSDIHLWLVAFGESIDQDLHSAYRDLLSDDEKEQEARFCFAKDRCRFRITRALARTVLSRYVAITPREWLFSTNAYGCPEIVNVAGRKASVAFNISHTQGLIVMGVARERALGVDVEKVAGREGWIDIAERYFAPQEVAALRVAGPDRRRFRFWEYWTFKEAYIKARKRGLSLPLDKFSFQYPDDHSVEIVIQPDLADDSSRWQFWQFRPTAEHLVAICAERIEGTAPSLVVRQAIPMLGETRIPIEFDRTSA